MILRHLTCSGLHTLAVLSLPALAMYPPRGLEATSHTGNTWPLDWMGRGRWEGKREGGHKVMVLSACKMILSCEQHLGEVLLQVLFACSSPLKRTVRERNSPIIKANVTPLALGLTTAHMLDE